MQAHYLACNQRCTKHFQFDVNTHFWTMFASVTELVEVCWNKQYCIIQSGFDRLSHPTCHTLTINNYTALFAVKKHALISSISVICVLLSSILSANHTDSEIHASGPLIQQIPHYVSEWQWYSPAGADIYPCLYLPPSIVMTRMNIYQLRDEKLEYLSQRIFNELAVVRWNYSSRFKYKRII